MKIGIVRHFKVDYKAKKLMNSKEFTEYVDEYDRAKEFLEKLDLKSEENILIVSHGFFLLTLIKELELIGFKGYTTKKMKNGHIYILEK